jgi:thioredoxin-like negative regulator of GroEL
MQQFDDVDRFKSIIEKDQVSVFLFTAGWCPDCHYLDTFFPEMIESHKDQAEFYVVNWDELKSFAKGLDVNGIPSLISFKGGKPIDRLVSPMRKTPEEVEQFLKNSLG